MGSAVGAQDWRGLVGSASTRIGGAWARTQSSPGHVRSGQQEPVRGRPATAIRLCAAPVAATAATLHGAGLQTAGPGSPLPRHWPAAPGLHTHALIKPCYPLVCLCPHEPGNLSHVQPGHVSLAASPRAGASLSTVGQSTHGPLGLSKLGRYTHTYTVPSDPAEQVGGSGVRVSAWSFITSPWGARGQGWSPGSPEIRIGMVLGRAGRRSHPAPTQVPVMETHGCEFGWAR